MKKVTVVTVCYNAEAHIEKTILSVINQTFGNFEYIVIDGNSSDSTLQLVKKHEQQLDLIISEEDRGIYDAMNKAINLASGEWIIFMNSNDWFSDNRVLEDVFSKNHSDADLLYGDHQFVNGDKIFHVQARSLSAMWQRISFSHQTLFSRTEIMKKYKFDLAREIVADYDFYYRCYARGYRFKHVGREVAVVSGGGFSSISFSRRTRERWMVVRKYTPSVKVNIFYLLFFFWGAFPATVKNFIRKKIKPLRQLP